MTKKLHRVEIVAFVMAEEGTLDEFVVASAAIDLTSCDVEAEVVMVLEQVPEHWRGAYPFGGEGDLTCEEIVEALETDEGAPAST